jgi:AraC-like DNA-binding protein
VPADRCKVPQAFWRAIERVGLPPPAVLRQAGLPATLHLNGRGLVTTAQFFALWKAIEALTDDPGLAFRLVQDTDTAVHPPSSLAAFHARDYRDGLTRLARFKRLCSPETLHIVERGGECAISVEWLHATEPVPAIAVDVDFASLVELGRRGTGQHLTPLRMELARSGPKTEAHKAFYGCPIRYSAPRNLLVLKTADLDRPFPGHNPELLDMLTPGLAATLGELQAFSSIPEQVKIALKRSLASGRPELADIAYELGMSERTLQRRITEQGTTFRDLIMEARQELGRTLLSDPSTDIDEVACLLGYQDTSSFYRAFREWEGVTPNQWRERNGRGGSGRPEATRLLH